MGPVPIFIWLSKGVMNGQIFVVDFFEFIKPNMDQHVVKLYSQILPSIHYSCILGTHPV